MGRRVTSVGVRRLCFFATLSACAVLLAACSGTKSGDPAIAQAFAGPVTLNLRREISPDSPTTTTAKHGEKLDILQMRRRFVRVRTPRGEEGWTDTRNLLSAEQMQGIADLAKTAAKMPSQGEATVFGILNVHTDPIRNSTSFFQINESMRVEVLAHRLAPRAGGVLPPPFQISKPAPAPRRRKPKAQPKYLPPARPPAPGLPENWRELSKTNLPPEPAPPPPPPPPVKPKPSRKRVTPIPGMEDWYLIRAKDGRAGWALARMVNLAIPEEVAQYSEGARITSYFALADVRDGDELKHHWIWTTIRGGQQPYQFDSFRIFAWVVKKHRYETAYIERGVEGYYPVEVTPGKMPRFSLILREEDGNLYRKTYIMEGYMVRKIEDIPYNPPAEPPAKDRVISNLPEPAEKDEEPAPSWGERIKSFFRRAGAS
jgi:hypothetical protein